MTKLYNKKGYNDRYNNSLTRKVLSPNNKRFNRILIQKSTGTRRLKERNRVKKKKEIKKTEKVIEKLETQLQEDKKIEERGNQ